MKPLLVLVVAFGFSYLIIKVLLGVWDSDLAGKSALTALLVIAAITHFAYNEGIRMMVPKYIPNKKLIVYLAGGFQLLSAIGLWIPRYSAYVSILLIFFFLLIMQANIYAAIINVDYRKKSHTGYGQDYLWIRVPLQLVFIVWTWYFGIYK